MSISLERPAVLRAITRLNVGGPARQALLLTRELTSEFPTTLVAGRPEPLEGELSDPAVTVHEVSLRREIAPWTDLVSLRQLRRLVKSTRARLVHTHTSKAGTIGRLAALTVRPRPAIVHTFHGHVLDGYFGSVVGRAFLGVERFLARRTDALIAISPEIRDELLKMGIGQSNQIRVIPLGFELKPLLAVSERSMVLRESIDLDGDVFLIGILGRLVPIKDHRTLLEAMHRLPQVHLAIVGDGELRTELEELASELGVNERVHFTSWWMNVAEAISDLDIVVLTSRNEGTPVSLIEAAAAGKPVVATDVGGTRFVVEEGVTGLLVPPASPQALARAIKTLLDDPPLRAAMGQAARVRVQKRFNSARLLSDIRALYLDVLSARSP